MVEAAWVAVEHHPHWKAQFERFSRRIGKQKRLSPLLGNCSWPSGMYSASRRLIAMRKSRQSHANC
ncbi:hypothetical protein [Ktedonobacter racemifer]|uniref:hypothetical protein n=1 Tax=Ktedonobacter racemifer TaxID=363277 RepID=UPI003B75C158